MTWLLKKFLKGLLYLVVLPLLLVSLCIYAVIGLVVFIIIGVKASILFFTGRNIFGRLPEDIKAEEIIKSKQQSLDTNPQQDLSNHILSSFTTNVYTPNDQNRNEDIPNFHPSLNPPREENNRDINNVGTPNDLEVPRFGEKDDE